MVKYLSLTEAHSCDAHQMYHYVFPIIISFSQDLDLGTPPRRESTTKHLLYDLSIVYQDRKE